VWEARKFLVYSLSLHRHSYIGFILAFASSIHNKLQLFVFHPTDIHTQVFYLPLALSLNNKQKFVFPISTSFIPLLASNRPSRRQVSEPRDPQIIPSRYSSYSFFIQWPLVHIYRYIDPWDAPPELFYWSS
jgi:hypothetical protein